MKTPVASTPVLTLLTVMPYHSSARWQCSLSEVPEAALQGNHLPRLSEEPTYSLQEGVGWQKVLDRDDFPSLFPLQISSL